MIDWVELGHGTLELVRGNIVEQRVDAIINAANTSLEGGGGVDGAIHRAAGPALLEECLKIPKDEKGHRCPTGEVRVTGAGDLPSKYVIHAVGPFYDHKYAEKAQDQLRYVHENALEAARERDCMSVAFPAISTGAYRFPIEQAAPIALETAARFLNRRTAVKIVRFVLFTEADLDTFRQAMKTLPMTGPEDEPHSQSY